MTQARAVWLALGGLMLTVVAAGGFVLLNRGEPHEYSSWVIEDSQMPLEIRLTDGSGEPFVLSDSMGPATAVYFGYTHCPDVCPLTMLELAAARAAMPEDRRDDLQVLMVTVDPERDTPEVMDRYVHHFDDSFVGLSGASEVVEEVMQNWGIAAFREEGGSDESYFMSHPSTVSVIDATGRLRLLIPTGLTPEAIAADLVELIETG